jgi:TadE-like protein
MSLPGRFRRLCRLLCGNEAAQIAELAVSLPLIAVLFVTTYDFGQAFNLKQKLVAATREGARLASNQPTSDLIVNSSGTCGAPASVCAIRDVIHTYFSVNSVNDCGLSSKLANPPTNWSWEFDASTGCGGHTFKVIINRGYPFSVALGANCISTPPCTVTVEATQITLIYPYQWQFNRAIQVLVPGSSYAAMTPITTNAVMQNLN